MAETRSSRSQVERYFQILIAVLLSQGVCASQPTVQFPATCAEAQTVDGLVTLYWQHNPSQPWSCSCFEGREYLRVNPILNWSFMKCGGGYSGTDLTTRFEGVRLDPHTGFVDRDDIAMAKTTTLMPSEDNLRPPHPQSDTEIQSAPTTATSTSLGSFSSSFARCGDRTYMPLGSAGDCVGMYQAHGQMQIDISDSPFRFSSAAAFEIGNSWAPGASPASAFDLQLQRASILGWGGWCGFAFLVTKLETESTSTSGIQLEYALSCNGFGCGVGFVLKPNPSTILCSGANCTVSQCCIATSVCPFNYVCGVGKLLKVNPQSITCAAKRCAVAECCRKTAVCSPQVRCGVGNVLKANPHSITCASSHCAVAECCEATATCSRFGCGPAQVLKPNAHLITCVNKRCSALECCQSIERYPFVQGSLQSL